MERHYGMDWLRIGAFALLIFYHIGMVFVPWGYHVKTAQPIAWATIPMFVTNAWRLALLFVVSGYASRALFAKTPRPGVFAGNRTKRLLIPLVFGIAVIVPPQAWVELVSQRGYAHGFWYFWTHDFFRFGTLRGLFLPAWNHLWFVGYLWVYTLALTLLLAIGRGGGAIQRGFEWVFGGWRLLVLPIGWFILVRVVLLPGVGETQTMVNDPTGHLMYLPCFAFGFLLAGSPHLVTTAARLWKPAALLALLGFIGVASVEYAWLGPPEPPLWASRLFRTARSVECWAAIVALIGVADRYWNHDHRWRPMLTEAVFPFYIIHQTIIVVAGWWLLRHALSPLIEFALLAVATTVGCWIFYAVGRRIEPLRPLIGLRHRVASAPRSATTAPVI